MTGSELRKRREKLRLSQAKFAELTGLPQHAVSAFELGKSELGSEALSMIDQLLADSSRVEALVGRKKRYQNGQSQARSPREDRSHLCRRTQQNSEYTRLIRGLENTRTNETKRLSALSLFAGCGGFSLGFRSAGFDVKGFVEVDDGLRRIYADNFPKSVECGRDITEVSSSDLIKARERIGEVDVIIGGPPCQGFSLSGKRDVSDPRNSLFRHYLRFVDCFRPKLAIMENVRLLTSMKNETGGFVRDDVMREFSAHGYTVKTHEINAKSFGVPQHRERVLFVAVLSDLGLDPSIPSPPHDFTADLFGASLAVRTFADACSDLSFLESGESCPNDPLHKAVNHPAHVIDWLWDVPQGRSAHDNDDEAMRPPSGYNTTYKRQVWDEPGATVQTTFGMISGSRNVHPVATRSLTIREAARLQSFPDTYQFSGSAGTIRTGIGNAVPPLLAHALGEHFKTQLSNLVEIARL